jgi:L-alanine-DL-glutamate epimerase-like enolase superfamily enzyme
MGLDMAFQNLKAARNNRSLAENLGLPPPGPRPMAFTIPVMEPAEIKPFMQAWNIHRFPWLKVKVNEALATDMVREVLKEYDGPIAIDGNEAWKSVEDVLEFQKQVSHPRILFLEQPLPAAQKEDYLKLKPLSSMEIWGDESVLSDPDLPFWSRAFDGINVKLMKAGSFENAICLLKTARSAGLKTMIGCMVETSLGISAAMALESLAVFIDLDGFLLIQNDPFHKVEEKKGTIFPL